MTNKHIISKVSLSDFMYCNTYKFNHDDCKYFKDMFCSLYDVKVNPHAPYDKKILRPLCCKQCNIDNPYSNRVKDKEEL